MTAITAMPAPRAGDDPLRHRQLMQQLEEVRVANGMSQTKLGLIFGVSQSTMWRFLNGAASMTPQQLSVTRSLVSLGSDRRSAWLGPFMAMEETASGLSTYEGSAVPGMLQIEDYAAHVIEAVTPRVPPAERAQMVSRRMARQKVLDREDPVPPFFDAIIGQAALHNLVGSPGVMREQMIRLAELAAHEYVCVRVLPFRAGGSLGSVQPFVLASFEEEERQDAAYAEDVFSGRQTEEKHEVIRLGQMWDALARRALSPDESTELIAEAERQWTT